jgi:outer membrane receptor protein involved in Fe transport
MSRTSGNNVTARLGALGQGTLEALMAAGRENCRPEVRDTRGCRGGVFSRGMDFSAAESLYADIQNGSFNVDDLNDDGVFNESDVILRASLDWRVNDSLLLFATYGQGFRHGVTNRNAGVGARNPRGLDAYDGYRVPAIAETDEMDSYELGMKGDFADKTLRLNATAYFSKISDLQVSRFDPANVAFLVFIENVGDAEIVGLDADFTWLPTPNLTISGAISLVDSEITRINPQLVDIAVPEGSKLPFSPDFSGSLRARYDFHGAFDGQTNAYVSGGISYSGSSRSGIAGSAFFVEDSLQRGHGGRGSGLEIANEGGLFAGGNCGTYDAPSFCPNGRYVQDSYVFLDLAFGVERSNWSAELYVDNVADKRAQLHVDTLQYVPKVVTNRPRTIGLRLSYDFDG